MFDKRRFTTFSKYPKYENFYGGQRERIQIYGL